MSTNMKFMSVNLEKDPRKIDFFVVFSRNPAQYRIALSVDFVLKYIPFPEKIQPKEKMYLSSWSFSSNL
uniref:Uncharacterized protein n=1 Tax=Schistosoma haematobium TaxID=6185 RepID=A0A094ZGI3_SCHHA